MGEKFKFKVQDSDLDYFFRRFDKHVVLSEKKLPLASQYDDTDTYYEPRTTPRAFSKFGRSISFTNYI
jgi:hypothetical protein